MVPSPVSYSTGKGSWQQAFVMALACPQYLRCETWIE